MRSQSEKQAGVPDPEPGFWTIATSGPVVKRATRIALIVGTVLAVINHGDRLLSGNIDTAAFLKILLTYFVPYSVSSYSSILAIRENAETSRRIRTQTD